MCGFCCQKWKSILVQIILVSTYFIVSYVKYCQKECNTCCRVKYTVDNSENGSAGRDNYCYCFPYCCDNRFVARFRFHWMQQFFTSLEPRIVIKRRLGKVFSYLFVPPRFKRNKIKDYFSSLNVLEHTTYFYYTCSG